MSNLAKIFKQTSWQILGKVVTSLSTFIILGVITRTYQESGTGTFTLALTYLAMFFLLADFGFNAHILKKYQISNIKYQKEEFRKLLGTRIIWAVVLIGLSICLLPFLPFATAQFSSAILLGSLAILGSAIFITCNLIFQEKLRYELSVLASTVGTSIYLVLILLLASKKVSLVYLVLAQALGWIVIGAVGMMLVKKILHSILPIFDKQYSLDLVKDSWPIALTLVLNVIYFRVDSFLIAVFKGTADVGVYNVAYSVFQSVLVLPTFIMNTYYPIMLRSLTGIKRIGLGLLALSSLGTIFTLIFAPLIIKILTGGGFMGSSQSLQILSLGFPAYFLSSLLMWLFVTKGQYKLMLLLYTSGLIINLILNFLYIPQYSFYAASLTTVISEYVILIMQINNANYSSKRYTFPMILTVYTDGASRGNPGKASFGFVIFDGNNHQIAERGKYIGINTNNFAEYTAVLEALQYIRKKFPKQRTSVNFLMDSKLVVEQLSGRFRVKSANLMPLVSQIRKLETHFSKISYQHVPRSGNSLADTQANLALDSLK